MTKGYIFDYGGTLDTGGNHWGKVLWHAYGRQHVAVGEEQFREAYVYAERRLGSESAIRPGFTFRETMFCKVRHQFDYLCASYGCDLPPEQAVAVVDDACDVAAHHTRRSAEVLRQLRDAGCPLAVVSNFYGNLQTVLEEHGLLGLFQGVVESAQVGIRKPDPAIFRLGVEALGLTPEGVTVVGDSMGNDIIPASQAGCHTVWIEGEQWKPGPVDRSIPGHIIHHLEELTSI